MKAKAAVSKQKKERATKGSTEKLRVGERGRGGELKKSDGGGQ